MEHRVGAGRVAPELKPRLRGLSHAAAFVIALPLGVALVLEADTSLGRIAAIAFAASVVAMFGASGLYHFPNWPEGRRRWLRRLEHAGVYGLIAGTYTPFGLLEVVRAWLDELDEEEAIARSGLLGLRDALQADVAESSPEPGSAT